MRVILEIIVKGQVLRKELTRGKKITVGRTAQSQWQIDDQKMSSLHCTFYLQETRLEIFDNDSKNGLYLNGIKVDQAEVFLGDRIKLGGTVIKIDESSMDDEAKRLLSFPGPEKERLGHELKVDFTGARIQNQLQNSEHFHLQQSQAAEINIRRRIRSQIKISKEQIRANYREKSIIASLIDLVIFLLFIWLPFMAQEEIPQHERFAFLVIFESIAISFYIVINYKIGKFTLGEGLSGIKKLYLKQ